MKPERKTKAMKRIQLNAAGKQYFDLVCGTPWVFNKKWSFYTTTAVLLQAVDAGFATVEIVKGEYGQTHFFRTVDGQLIRKQYTDYTNGFDTWNPYRLPVGINNLSKEGVYNVTCDDIDAACLMFVLPSVY